MDDWDAEATNPPFSLFDNTITPLEAIKKFDWLDIVVYSQWSKAERRLYQKLKCKQVTEALKKSAQDNIDSLSAAFDQLKVIKNADQDIDSEFDDLIKSLEQKLSITKNKTQ